MKSAINRNNSLILEIWTILSREHFQVSNNTSSIDVENNIDRLSKIAV